MTAARLTSGEPNELDALVALARREHLAGRLAQAAAAYHEILRLWPGIAEAYNNLGVVLREQGKLDQAVARYEQALALKPDLAEAHNNLGNTLKQQGKLDQAATRFQQALALRPDYAEACNSLGNILLEQGKLDQAAARYEQALALRPDYAEACNNLGNVCREQGEFDQATARFQQAIALKPDLVEAYNNLGNIYLEQGELDQAVARYDHALALRPDYAEAHNNLGNALKQQGKFEEAAARYEQALVLRPNYAEAHNNLGVIHWQQGKLDRAVACYEQALTLQADYAAAHSNLGNVLLSQGKFEAAAARYEQALALRPDYAEAHYYRVELKTFRPGDADLAALETLAAAPHLAPDKMPYVHFALGKALEDVGDYPRAFEHLRLGNALKRRQVHYNEEASDRNFRLIAAVFDSGLLDRFAGVGDSSEVPIFVLGMPRSGSTLIEQILASHPQVHAAGELVNLGRVVNAISESAGRQVAFPQSISAMNGSGLRQLGQAYLASLPAPTVGKLRIIDKVPGNFLYVGLIHLILPNARIIHTMRDPVDTCVSCFSRLFVDLPFSYDLGELGRYYRRYRELMAHWRSVLPAGAMIDVRYEDVVDNLEEQARRLIAYCGLPWDNRCLNFHETSRPITTASNVQVRRPLYRSSLARWRHYEAYLEPLLAELEGCRP